MKKLLFLFIAAFSLSITAFADSSDVYFATDSFTVTKSASNVINYSSVGSGTVYYYNQYRDSANNSVLTYAISTDGTATIRAYTPSDGNTDTLTFEDAPQSGWYSKLLTFSNPASASYSPAISIFAHDAGYNSIIAALQNYIDNPPQPSVMSAFSVPCGNVAYFQVSSAQTVDFKSTYKILSSLFANSTYGYWSDSGQRFGPAASLPTSSTTFPIASQEPLYWSPDPQSKNLLGLSKTGLASASCIIGQWYAFYNPAYNSNNTDWTTMDITGATVLISGSFSSIKIYPLEQVVDYQNGSFVGGSNDDYQSYFDGNIGADGSVSFTNQDGVTDAPIAGGQNLLAPNETAQSLIDKVVGLLQNIISEIKSLFSFGYEAINDLAGLMGDFASAVSVLYTWLPAEVHAALISAVSIAIVIGVFKVFI